MKSLLFTAILSLRKRSEQILIKFAILLQVRLTHAQTFFRGVSVHRPVSSIYISGVRTSVIRSMRKVKLSESSLRAGSLGEREPARIPMIFTCMRPIFGRRALIG